MSGVLKKATGLFADAYAEKYLFGPLGIEDYHWKKSPKGYPDTEGGLFLEALQGDKRVADDRKPFGSSATECR